MKGRNLSEWTINTMVDTLKIIINLWLLHYEFIYTTFIFNIYLYIYTTFIFYRHSRPPLTPSTKENLQSPQIYGVVEKEDSISWIIDIEQGKGGFASTHPVKRITKFNKEVLTKSPKSSPDQLKKSTTRLTTLQKKNLLRWNL